MKTNVKIVAIDSYVAQNTVTNDDLTKILDTSDEWISSRTGIKQRRIISGDLTSTDLGIEAANSIINRAIKKSNYNPEDIDLIIAAASAAEDFYPSVACKIQNALMKNGWAKNAVCFDLRAACAGLLYSMNTARAFIKAGIYKNILIVATDATTKYTDWEDRSVCVLFGDGAGAMLLSATDKEDDIKEINLLSDGSCGDYITLKIQGKNCPLVEEIQTKEKPFITMKGKDVYKFVMQEIPPKITELLDKLKMTASDIDYFIPHQSNHRMIEALAKRLEISEEKVISNIDKYGNMSAASIPVAIKEAIDKNEIKLPATVLISAFGAGMTAGNAIIKLNETV